MQWAVSGQSNDIISPSHEEKIKLHLVLRLIIPYIQARMYVED